MSYNGSGTFLINSAGQPVVANTVISATVFNALTSDLATGLSTAITKDGQTTITANIPFGSNKITGLGSGTAATDAANLGQVQSTAAKLVTVTGTDTITGSMSPQLTAYAAGQLFYFVANAANTGAVTINIDSLGAKAITRDGSTALAAGDINSGEVVVVIYDGTRFQMINAANSFGNTTINGTLTVTGNTGLQANVSITSTLSVGGTFAVTGAATLGSTLAVTGKSDLPTVSTASINAAVALITTGTVTNLTASGASIASANIGNLQFTAASIASINAGVAVITNLTATGASIASANVGTAVITAATVTGASIASANVGTAVITTGTVTNLTSTSASVASINAAVALITTGTVSNLTSTGASIASANVGVGVITALTATGASVASANVGTAVVTGLTVTNASIASLNAGTATVTTGNLTFSSTGQRITGDFSNATQSNRLSFQTSTTNGNTAVHALPNGTSQTSAFNVLNNSDPTNASLLQLQVTATEARLNSSITGTGTQLPMTFLVGGERMRLDTSGNLGIGTTNAGTAGLSISQNLNLSWEQSSTESIANLFRQTSSAALVMSVGYKRSATANGFASSYGSSLAKTAISLGTTAGAITFYTDTAATTAVGTDVTPTERMRIDSSGNVGIGTSTANKSSSSTALTVNTGTAANYSAVEWSSNNTLNYHINANDSAIYHVAAGTRPWIVYTNGTERLRIDSSGNVGIGTASPNAKLDVLTTASTRLLFTERSTGGNVIDSVNGGNTAYTQFLLNGSTLIFATGATERARIDSSGNVGIGTASPTANLEVGGSGNKTLRVGTTSNSYAYLNLNTWALDRAQLRAEAANPSAGSGTGAGKLTIWTANAGSLVERMAIDGAGNVIAGGSVALATTATDGFLYVPTCAGTPTGTPTAVTGMAPIVVNTTNNKLYFYSGGAWRDAGP